MAHAILSPSKASRWMACPGSVGLEAGIPDQTSAYAAEGTAAHELAAAILGGLDVQSGNPDMLQHVMFYVDTVRHIQGDTGQLFIEQKVEFSETIGVPDSFGTSDCVILDGDTITLVDLKYGMGVKVDAIENEQLQIYALAALEQFGMAHEFKKARLVIVQPRLDHISEWEISIEDLVVFGERAREAAAIAMQFLDGDVPTQALNPTEKGCRFCKAKATCPALLNMVLTTVADDFVDITKPVAPQLGSAVERIRNSDNAHLGSCLGAVGIIEDWCSAVRAKAESELLAGRDVPGFKLVQGRQGARKWKDTGAAADTLVQALGNDAYDVEVISPTSAEKLLKGTRSWKNLEALITRSEGRPSVAPLSDKRPAISAAASPDEFSAITN